MTDSPPFAPSLVPEGTSLIYDDGRVSGMMEVRPDGALAILEWNSDHPGRGHSIEALQWLRERYPRLAAVGIGEFDDEGIPDISINYWERIREKGLVDLLVLDDGTEWVPAATPRGP